MLMRRRQAWIVASALVLYGLLRAASTLQPAFATSRWRAHGADFLAPLVLIPVFHTLQIVWGLRETRTVLHGRDIIAYVAALGLAFEVILPVFVPRMVADPVDALAYAAGGWLLWCLLPKQREESTSSWRLRHEGRA